VIGLLIARSHQRLRSEPGMEIPGRSTLQTVRQRAYLRGWIRDRYLPAPDAFGLDRLTFALARPPMERAPKIVERWQTRADNVLLWATDEAVLGVFLQRVTTGHRRPPILEEADVTSAQILEVDCSRDAIPVYFDFEMAWVRATGLPGVSSGYPRTLPGLTRDPLRQSIIAPPPSQLEDLIRLVSFDLPIFVSHWHPRKSG
jgi:hypothetical protein